METWYICQIEDGQLGILGSASSESAAERKLAKLWGKTSAGLFVTCDLDYWEDEAAQRAATERAEDWWALYGEMHPDHDGGPNSKG